MSDQRKLTSFTPNQLADLLAKLDAVMTEAERLRERVSRQLAEQGVGDRQRLTTIDRRRKPRKKP